MKSNQIALDLNCDVGEGTGNEAHLFKYITSCNIACGGHAGSRDSMYEVVELAQKHQIQLGAHPSYPDRENFGRISMEIEPHALSDAICEQLQSLEEVIQEVGGKLHHIKAHGALYNDLAGNINLANTYLDCLEPFKNRVLLFAPCNSIFAIHARKSGFKVWEEAFADRRYLANGSLVPRSLEGAVIESPNEVWKQLQSIIWNHSVQTLDGALYKLMADTCCVHGDTPGAEFILAYVAEKLNQGGLTI